MPANAKFHNTYFKSDFIVYVKSPEEKEVPVTLYIRTELPKEKLSSVLSSCTAGQFFSQFGDRFIKNPNSVIPNYPILREIRDLFLDPTFLVKEVKGISFEEFDGLEIPITSMSRDFDMPSWNEAKKYSEEYGMI